MQLLLLAISLKVTNKGKRKGDEITQAYIGSDNKNEDRPVKVLKGFSRVSVEKGETVNTEVSVLIDDIKFYCPEKGEWMLDESYTVYIGTDSKNVTAVGKVTF